MLEQFRWLLSALARTLKPIVPHPLYRSIQMNAARRHANRWLDSVGVFPLAVKAAERFAYTVQAGPFTGMRYTRSALLSRHATPALLGVYERQLYPFLEMARRRCDLVVDIGSAEGYFAVGLAQSGKRVIAFDADPHERKICKEMAAANHLADRVEVRSWCSPGMLIGLVKERRALIISDIDGGELDLFTPEVISAIRHCDLIVEMHGKDAEENAPFIRRFDGSAVKILGHPPADPAAIERLSFLAQDAARMATEYRSFQQWLLRAGG
jgi:hypothetical protein